MIRIAIVDDDKYAISSCENLIHSLNIPNLDIIDSYDSSEKFLDEIISKKTQYDIVILDIDMPDANGFDIARQINELDDGTIIIFYTAHEQYVFKAYEFQPFRYIRKEYAKVELPNALKFAIEKLENKQQKNILIKCDGSEYRIKISKIEYFEKYDHFLEIHLINEHSIKTRATITQILETIDDSSFIYVNKGSVINIKYLERVNTNDIVLTSGKIINISRRNYKTIKAEFSKYIGGLL